MSQQVQPSAAQIEGFVKELKEARSRMTPENQKCLDAVVAVALKRQVQDVTAYWGPGTPSTAIGTTDWATSVFGHQYGSAYNV